MSISKKAFSAVAAAALLPISAIGLLPGAQPAMASTNGTQSCPAEGENPLYTFANKTVSTRPTDVYSAYITGPGTITFNETDTATVSASVTATVSAEAGVVFAKASTSLGVSVTGGRSWTTGFSYSLSVPSGQRRRMRLFQESRAFTVTKQTWNAVTCQFVTNYSTQSANAPLTTRVDEWKLEA